MSSFERGWVSAIALWNGGMTWETITHKADARNVDGAYEYARGMVAAVDAMSGWIDLARREARAYGIRSTVIDALVARAVQS